MDGKTIAAVVTAILGSGIIQWFFSRRDKSKEIEKKLDVLTDKVDTNQANNARVHLLRFADELRAGSIHSRDYFRQTLLDANFYEAYCQTHPDFSNGITELSIEYIKNKYREELENGTMESN